MGEKTLVEELRALVGLLGELRDATPMESADYKIITDMYQNASDLALKEISIEIDQADKQYVKFAEAMQAAMESIRKTIEKTEKVAKTIQKIAKVLDLAGKIIGKVV